MRAAEADIEGEQALQNDFKRHISMFQYSIGTKKSNQKRFLVPGDILIDRASKRIQKDRRLIDYFHIDNQLIQARIKALDVLVKDLDDFREKTDDVDINYVRTQKIDYSKAYKNIDEQFKIYKSSQYPVLNNLHEWKRKLSEQEMLYMDDDYKCQLVGNHLEKLKYEIDLIKSENESIEKENKLLKEQIADIKKVPTITEYAHVIQETKNLRHQIDVWTRRVHVAEVRKKSFRALSNRASLEIIDR